MENLERLAGLERAGRQQDCFPKANFECSAAAQPLTYVEPAFGKGSANLSQECIRAHPQPGSLR